MDQKLLGRYIVTDPRICHGQPTFRGTRIMVSQVLEQVASGMAWETIVEEWRGSVPKEAVAEAVRLAMQAFVEHADEYVVEMPSARSSWMRTFPKVSGNCCEAGAYLSGRLATKWADVGCKMKRLSPFCCNAVASRSSRSIWTFINAICAMRV